MGRGCFRAGLYVCGWTWSTMSPSPQCCSSNSALFTLDRPGRWTTLCFLQATENLRKPVCGRCVKFHREQSCMCAYGQQVNGSHDELLSVAPLKHRPVSLWRRWTGLNFSTHSVALLKHCPLSLEMLDWPGPCTDHAVPLLAPTSPWCNDFVGQLYNL